MFRHRFDHKVDTIVVLNWFLLSFNGGAINAGGFMATGKFVSHITGFATLFGVSLTDNDLQAAFGILTVPIFFLLGAFIAGLLIDRPLNRRKKPHFDWVMGLSAFCLLLAISGGEALHFGKFGFSFGIKESYLLMALLCLASGLQNGAITSSSGRSIRTTHLTGLTTDLGLGLSRVLTFDLKNDQIKNEIRANYIRIGSILSFVIGSAIGAWVFLKFGYRGFLLPAAISIYASWQGRKANAADSKF